MLEYKIRPLGAETADYMLKILEGRETAALEELREWLDYMKPKVEALRQRDAAQPVNTELPDAYRARLYQAYLRAREQVEMIVLDLERRVQAMETAG